MSAKFAGVIRCIKHASYVTLAESGRHQWREKKVPNADPERLHLNTDLRPVSGSKQLVEAVKKRVQLATENKDGVPCLEYMLTANHAAFKSNGGYVDDESFVKDSIDFLEDKHGKDNIVALNIQRDEKAIHVVAFVVPLIEIKNKKVKRSIIVGKDKDGKILRDVREVAVKDSIKLSASHFVDGPKKLAKLHTDFAKKVGKKHGIERGIERSLANNVTIKEWYSAINSKFEHPKIEPRHIDPKVINEGRFGIGREVESLEDVCVRLNRAMKDFYNPIVLASKTAKIDRERAQELARTLRREQQKFGELTRIFDELPRELKEKTLKDIQTVLEQHKLEQRQESSASHQLLALAAQSMQLENPLLSERAAFEEAERLMSNADPEFDTWLAWMPAVELQTQEQTVLHAQPQQHRDDDYAL